MIERVEDVLEAGGLVRTRWVADAPIVIEHIEEGWQVKEWEDVMLSLYYVELRQAYRGPVEIHFPALGPKKFIRVLAWAIQGDKVSQCMQEGAQAFGRMVGRWPRFAYIWKLPVGAQEFVEVMGVMLVQVDWAIPGFLFIGG